jgi:hypothetical protein
VQPAPEASYDGWADSALMKRIIFIDDHYIRPFLIHDYSSTLARAQQKIHRVVANIPNCAGETMYLDVIQHVQNDLGRVAAELKTNMKTK